MSQDLIAGLASLDADFMPDAAVIRHATPGPDNPDGSPGDGGGVTETTVACRCAPSGGSPQETLIASRLTDTTPFTFSFPVDVSISEKDTIQYAGANYECLGVLAPTTFMTSVRAVCKRVS